MPRKSKKDENLLNDENSVAVEPEKFEEPEINESSTIEEDVQIKTKKECKLKAKFKQYFKLFISFGLCIVLTALISILVFDAIEKSNRKKEEAKQAEYLKTVYQVGDIDVPSFENLTGKKCSAISDVKYINTENPTELITYTFKYDDITVLNENIASYTAKLKSENFIITTESILKSFNEGKISVTVKYNTYAQDDKIVLEIIFDRNL